MDAGKCTVKELFQRDVRYVIPVFQRPYVWDQEQQWDPLWEDVRNITERYLDAMEDHEQNKEKAEASTGTHFLGAVVLQQITTATTDIDRRDVIDGQQRMTTLQILLDAAQEVMEQEGHALEAKRLSRLVLNDEDFSEGDHRFKLWPTTTDQAPFRAAMTNGATADEYKESLIARAHDYFREQISHWLLEGYGGSREQRAKGLYTALCGLLEVVVIDLQTTDDAHVIFETLNARGTPLLASDLVKNFILQTASGEGAGHVELESLWSLFETPWWRAEVRQGRIIRPRIDVFLNYWLIARTRTEISSQQVFPEFKKYFATSGQTVQELIADMQKLGKTYAELKTFPANTWEESFIYRWDVMQAGVTTPVLLVLFGATADELSPERRKSALRAIESFLVRRMLCRMTTKDYNRMFLELLGRLEHKLSLADEVVTEFLASQTAESRLWPSDKMLLKALKVLPVYRMLTRGRLRLVLEGIEDELRTGKAEERTCQRGLTIEHVLPQKWAAHWPLEAEDAESYSERSEDRDQLLHTLGNLTLLNEKLNPSLSNGSWTHKKGALQEHSTLFLNKRLLASYAESAFLEHEINERGVWLASIVCGVWPGGRINSGTTGQTKVGKA